MRFGAFHNLNGFYVIIESHNYMTFDIMVGSPRRHAPMINSHTLLPLSFHEMVKVCQGLDKVLVTGFYPVQTIPEKSGGNQQNWSKYIRGVFDRVEPYLSSIFEHAMGEIPENDRITANKFETYMKILTCCAEFISEKLSKKIICAKCGVNKRVLAIWINILESMYIIHTLGGKLYFYDVGIACHLLNIKNEIDCLNHPLGSNLFKSMIVSELFKIQEDDSRVNISECDYSNNIQNNTEIVYRRRCINTRIMISSKSEIDLDGCLIWKNKREIERLKESIMSVNYCVIYTGDVSRVVNNINIISWKHINPLLYNCILAKD